MLIPPFPTDDTTLDLIWTALNPGPESERTSLNDLLDLYSRLAGSDPDAVDEVIEEADPYDSGRFGFDIHVLRDPQYHEHDVIRSLITEVRNYRTAVRLLRERVAQQNVEDGYLLTTQEVLAMIDRTFHHPE
jgi:hypothetical protein